MKKSFVILLFLSIPMMAQQKEQEGRYRIYFQPTTDAGITVTILLDSQTGKAWQLIRDDSLYVSYDDKPPINLQPNKFYAWHPIIFESYPSTMPSFYNTLPPPSKK